MRPRAWLAALLLVPPAWAQEQSADYAVRITLNWQVAEGDGATNPHWSRLIAVSHSSRYALFEDGDTASSGLALVATNGRVSVLEVELAEARRRGRAGEPLVLPGVASGEAVFDLEMTLSDQQSQVSLATMLAPSPDWFTGVSGVNLRQDGAWRDTLRVPLWVWDAGADSGPEFSSLDAPTQPRQSVRLLTHPAFLKAEGLSPIGWVEFSRLR